uniref:Uncharacterized protein n=1 Tax=Arundo donax TaxID=35708 RepID=A0A0A9AAY6_ARUDO
MLSHLQILLSHIRFLMCTLVYGISF